MKILGIVLVSAIFVGAFVVEVAMRRPSSSPEAPNVYAEVHNGVRSVKVERTSATELSPSPTELPSPSATDTQVVQPTAPAISLVETGSEVSNGYLIVQGKLFNETIRDLPCSTKNFLLIADGTSDEPSQPTGLGYFIAPSGCHTATVPPHTFSRFVMSFLRDTGGSVTIRYKSGDAEATISGDVVLGSPDPDAT